MSNMTYRDLILYILANGLEDTPVFQNGKIAGFQTVPEAAVRLGVGEATVRTWISLGQIDTIQLNDVWYIPENVERKTDEKSNSNTSNRTTGIRSNSVSTALLSAESGVQGAGANNDQNGRTGRRTIRTTYFRRSSK